jgi:hypothetical protein
MQRTGRRRGGEGGRAAGTATTAAAAVSTSVDLPRLSATTLYILPSTSIGSAGSAGSIAKLAVLISYTAIYYFL